MAMATMAHVRCAMMIPTSHSKNAGVSMQPCALRLRRTATLQQSALGSFTGFPMDNRLQPEPAFGSGEFGLAFLGRGNGSTVVMISHGRRVPKLGRPADQRKALLRGLTTQLLRHGRIKTTRARAKAMRHFAEKMITLAKGGSLHQRRQALGYIYDKQLVHALFAEVPDRYGERNGGYTRIIRTMPRRGDNAPMSYIELV